MAPFQAYTDQFFYDTATYPMSAAPYSPSAEQYSIVGVISVQLHYYFSVDNLCKDMYLRKHMDSQGFVFLDFISGFNRLKLLTTDLELIKYACLQTKDIEMRVGDDGNYRLRKQEGWEQWVLDSSERDPSARNDGPVKTEPPPMPYSHGFKPAAFRESPMSPLSPYTNYGPPFDSVNGIANGYTTGPGYVQTPNGDSKTHAHLSAIVPNFEPGGHAIARPYGSTRNTDNVDGDAFPNENIERLFVLRMHGTVPAREPLHSSTPRRSGSGSSEMVTLNPQVGQDDDQQLRAETNGISDVADPTEPKPRIGTETSPISHGDLKGPVVASAFDWPSTDEPQAYDLTRLFWVKESSSPVRHLPPDSSQDLYVQLREKALSHREAAIDGTCPHEMDVLYHFWADFLVRNFNTQMYEEFRSLALEDATRKKSRAGLEKLLQFYAASFDNQNTIRDRVARDYAELVKSEDPAEGRPAFKQMRAAWRNGALNLKNRKKMVEILDADLKAELER